MLDLFTGPLALAFRYALILAAGFLARAGLAIFDSASGVITIRIEDAANVAAAFVVFALAIVWRWLAKKVGGKT